MRLRKVLLFITIVVLPLIFGHNPSVFADVCNWRKIDVGLGGALIGGVAMTKDGGHIVLTGGDFTLHSRDYGNTWERFGISSDNLMVFSDSGHLFATGSSQGCNLPNGYAEIARSNNFGNSWSATLARPPMCFRGIFAWDSLHVWAVGDNKDSVVYSTDGGLSLKTLYFGLSDFDARGVIFLDSLNGFVVGWKVGTDSSVLRTRDGGMTWRALPVGIYSLVGINADFVDTLHGWMIGATGARRLYHTGDGGRTWTEQGSFGYFSGDISEVQAVDSLHAWVFGDYFSPYIWKTEDGGQTWALEYNGPGSYFTDAIMVDAQHGIMVGDQGTVLIYTPQVVLGDLNGDGQISTADVVLELNKVFLDQPFACLDQSADLNCDGAFSAVDVVLLLNRVFLNSPFPCSL